MEHICNIKNTLNVLEIFGLKAKKGYGQNFLIDENIINAIVKAAEVTKEDTVLEIGPGIGSLTEVLAKAAKSVVALEIDSALIPVLDYTLSGISNVKVINANALKVDLKDLAQKENAGKPFKVVANLPYYITTPLLEYLIENREYVSSLTLMMQKEVAKRITAKSKKEDYGAISLFIDYYTDSSVNFMVSPNCFMPKPKVESAVITLKMLKEPKVDVSDEDLMFSLIKKGFLKRRKVFKNCLEGEEQERFLKALSALGLSETTRAEDLKLKDFAAISNYMSKG